LAPLVPKKICEVVEKKKLCNNFDIFIVNIYILCLKISTEKLKVDQVLKKVAEGRQSEERIESAEQIAAHSSAIPAGTSHVRGHFVHTQFR
jgi:hypothetical protein